MKRHLLKKEWETNIQDYKNSGLSKAAWCQKQNITVSDYKYNFSFSLLQTLPKTVTPLEVLEIESLYKEKLGTRKFGYNSN
ncbi:hypothetical protein AALF16_23870 [Bacillus cereus]|uniref:IS66 family insertion sequence element accessory protein TnpA n=1 Tax=Bacillus cereus TaxID=1396 RepID=UPI00356C60FE